MDLDFKSFLKLIDHTILKSDATPTEVDEIVEQAREFNFASVCVNGLYVKQAVRALEGVDVMVAVTVGFPLGAMATEVKALEAKRAVDDGAREVDMVLPVGLLKAGEDTLVYEDILAVVKASGAAGVKVILETCYLTNDEKRRACLLAKDAGAAFVKTSTGFGSGGATAEDVALMRSVVGDSTGVKASGGVRTIDDVKRMVEAGANRIGTSAGYKMAKEWKSGLI